MTQDHIRRIVCGVVVLPLGLPLIFTAGFAIGTAALCISVLAAAIISAVLVMACAEVLTTGKSELMSSFIEEKESP